MPHNAESTPHRTAQRIATHRQCHHRLHGRYRSGARTVVVPYFVEPPQLVLRALHERRLVEPALFGAATSDVPSTADAAAAAAASASR